nr:unnamed protein product [Naegleria fowleri]
MSETAQEFDEETRKCIELSRKRLEPLVSKIPLQDKHLARPPVAFLKALVLCLVRERGYPEGLFDEEFLKTKKDLTNEEKTNFLKQLINVVIHTIKKNIPVNIQLIIKGKESPKNITVFFQALAEAAGNKDKYQYREAIEKIKSGKYKDYTEREAEKKKAEDGQQQQNAATPNTPSDSSGASNSTSKQQQQQKTATTSASAQKQSQQPPQQAKQPTTPSTLPTTNATESKPQQQQQVSGSSPTTTNSPSLNQDQGRPSSRGVTSSQTPASNKPPTPSKDERSTTPNSIDQKASVSRPSSGREVSKPSTPNTNTQDYQQQQQPLAQNQEDPNLAQYSRPFSSRGQSARRAPPKIKTNVRTIDTQEMPTEKTLVETKAAEGLITDENEDKEDDQIIIEKNVAVKSSTQSNTNTEQKGTLVNKLMENESDIEKKRNAGKVPNAKPSNDEPVKGIVLQTGKKEKDKEVITTELSTLREQIQTLISKVNPLGKTMDYIQEDLDSMQREHDMWRKDVELQRQRLIEERLKTDQEVSSVQAQLKELEQNIVDKLEKINSLRSTILQKDKLLETLLRNVVA